ncbi:ABC transporter permease [Miniphocaeibacter massiliensis]|uniref:ABC transporter permease n=1 Tax=Miniphocaeibacter massiliensis TaxID=2041841 RepID=UPI000C07FD64|nr:ABC transporter permease [Miniphocaeibacter massiliensis]
MLNNYILKIKEFAQNKSTMFFSLLFPIILTTLFYLTIARMDNAEAFTSIPIAVENSSISETFKDIEASKEKKLFKIVNTKNYENDLKNKNIKAYIKGNENLKVIVYDNDTSASIVYETVNMYNHIQKTYEKVMTSDINVDVEEISKTYNEENNITNKFDSSNKKSSLIYFFSLLAMTCLSASNQGVDVGEILNPKSDMEYVKRILISPVQKFKLLMSHFLGALTFSLFVSYITVLYMLILKIPIIDYLPKIITAVTLGTILGLSQGMLVSALVKAKLITKYNINAVLYVFSSFLAGLMSNNIPYLVNENFPLLNYINPATIITNTFKSIYYFENSERFFSGLINTVLLFVVFLTITLFVYRRKKYENT